MSMTVPSRSTVPCDSIMMAPSSTQAEAGVASRASMNAITATGAAVIELIRISFQNARR